MSERGRFFVGHFFFHVEAGGPLVQSFGLDWNETLLRKKTAEDLVKDGMSDGWSRDLAEKIATAGTAILHFYVTKSEKGDHFDIVDCDPGCPAAAQARIFLSPTRGEA